MKPINPDKPKNSLLEHKFKKVVVLYGGRSKERDISLKSGKAVIQALEKNNYIVEAIDWQGKTSIKQVLDSNCDCVFIALHGIDGEDGSVQALLEILELPYTGSGILASSLCMDKIRAKQVLKTAKLPILEDITLEKNTELSEIINKLNKISFPLCVKPVQQGSSLGVFKVENLDELKQAWQKALEYDDIVMVEPWISGGEYTVGILNNRTLPSIKLEATGEFYDYNAKYISNDTKYYCPSGLSYNKEQEIQDLAMRAFKALACDEWARVDFVADENNNFYILEVNTVPGLTSTSLVPKAAKQIGMEFDELVIKIVNNASLKQLNSVINNLGSKQNIFNSISEKI